MSTLTRRIVSMGITMQADELMLLEYAIVAVGADPDKINLEGKNYISLKKEHVQKYLPEVLVLNGNRYINCVNALFKHGFIEKKVHAEVAYYTTGPMMQDVTGFSFMQPVAPAANKAATPKISLEDRRKKFAQLAIDAGKEHNNRVTASGGYVLTKENLKSFIDYWTAPLVKNPNKMLYENEDTFVFSQRLATAIKLVYAKGPGSVHRHPTLEETTTGIANVRVNP